MGKVLDVIVVESGNPDKRHIKVLVEVDLMKPLMRGTMLRFKQEELWVQFKYEHLPTYCFSCGHIRHTERACQVRKGDVASLVGKERQFGPWLKAGFGSDSLGGEEKKDMLPAGKADIASNSTCTKPGMPLGGRELGVRGGLQDEQGEKVSDRMVSASPLASSLGPAVAVLQADPVGFDSLNVLGAAGMEGESGGTGLKEDSGMALDFPNLEYLGTTEGSKGGTQDTETTSTPRPDERVPLKDCPTQLQGRGHSNQAKSHCSHKGHWKRKARLQGKESISQELMLEECHLEISRKRDRTVEIGDTGLSPVILAEKKGKWEGSTLSLSTVEVGAASLNWAQLHK